MSKKIKNKIANINQKNNFTKKQLFVIFFTTFVLSFVLVLIYRQQLVQEFLFDREVRHDTTISAPAGNINVEIADNSFERERGLSFRKSMKQDEGMLFIFDELGKYGFWVKDMNFPLDVVWINEEGRVVYEVNNVSLDTYPGVFINEVSARYVLEVNAGVTEKLGIYLGTKLAFSPELLK